MKGHDLQEPIAVEKRRSLMSEVEEQQQSVDVDDEELEALE